MIPPARVTFGCILVASLFACPKDEARPPPGAPTMDEDRFWELIARAGSSGEAFGTAEALTRLLSKEPADTIVAFEAELDRRMAEAYRWDLWGAAYLVNGGCSDDCFVYFRTWLISRGRARFEQTLRDPDSLADWVKDGDGEYEDLLYSAQRAYELEAPGKPLRSGVPHPRQPAGEKWTEDDLPARFPKLAAKFLE